MSEIIIEDLKEKHPFIYYTAMLRYDQIRGGNGKGSEIYSFTWEKTREGIRIWGRVAEGNFKPFYEYHGRNPKTGLLEKNT